MFELPAIDLHLTSDAMCAFIRDMARKTGARSLVLGLSGGIDSAIVACMAASAKTMIPLHLYWLPYKTSSPQSLADARAVADMLEIELKTRDISAVVDGAIGEWEVDGKVRIGNFAARARMMALFDASAMHEGVVLGTSNLSERYLGYGTLHGDLACAFNPIGNLLKTEVRALAGCFGVPRSIIEKPPTADLWAAQTDEGELGFSYADADRVLFLAKRMGLGKTEVEGYGLSRELVNAVLDRVSAYAYKSQPVALGPLPI